MLNLVPSYSNNPSYKKVSFCGSERLVKDGARELYYTTTSLFRYDLNWHRIFSILKEEKPQKIYSYGCSDGSEPYSIVMGLTERFGAKKVQKFFPILARDLDSQNIQRCRLGIIDILSKDFVGVSENMDIRKVDTYFPYRKIQGQMKRVPAPSLRDNVRFRQANFIEDAPNLDYRNSVIFCRNIWPYFGLDNVVKTLRVFADKFTEKTKLVLGGYEFQTKKFDMRGLLSDVAHLKEDETCPLLFRKKQ